MQASQSKFKHVTKFNFKDKFDSKQETFLCCFLTGSQMAKPPCVALCVHKPRSVHENTNHTVDVVQACGRAESKKPRPLR